MQTGDRAQNGGENQRHDDHLQQLNIAVTDDIEPLDRILQHRAVGTIDKLQRQAEDNADNQTDQHFFSEAPLFMAGLGQRQQ